MEDALALEKAVNAKLLQLHKVAEEDPNVRFCYILCKIYGHIIVKTDWVARKASFHYFVHSLLIGFSWVHLAYSL